MGLVKYPAKGPIQSKAIRLNAADLGMVDTADLVTRLEELFASAAYTPPVLPSAAVQLMQLARNKTVEIEQITDLLQNEQMLAARVMQIAQSPIYSRGNPIRTLDEAIMRIGLMRSADLFLQATLDLRVFRCPAFQGPMDRLRRHSAATAEIARWVCRQTAAHDEFAFVCGLLHDVGIAAAILALAESTRCAEGADFGLAWPAVRQVHQTAATRLSAHWKLPADIGLVIGHHHDFVVGGHAHPLAAVVCVADGLASALGAEIESEVTQANVDAASEVLGLSTGVMDQLWQQAEEIVAQIE